MGKMKHIHVKKVYTFVENEVLPKISIVPYWLSFSLKKT